MSERTCPACGADEREVRAQGHRLMPDRRPCPEACTCIPEHVSMDEHRAAEGETAAVDGGGMTGHGGRMSDLERL